MNIYDTTLREYILARPIHAFVVLVLIGAIFGGLIGLALWHILEAVR